MMNLLSKTFFKQLKADVAKLESYGSFELEELADMVVAELDNEYVLLSCWLAAIKMKADKLKFSREKILEHFTSEKLNTVSQWWSTCEIKAKNFATLIRIREFRDVEPIDLESAKIRLSISAIAREISRHVWPSKKPSKSSKILKPDELFFLIDAHMTESVDLDDIYRYVREQDDQHLSLTKARVKNIMSEWGMAYRIFQGYFDV